MTLGALLYELYFAGGIKSGDSSVESSAEDARKAKEIENEKPSVAVSSHHAVLHPEDLQDQVDVVDLRDDEDGDNEEKNEDDKKEEDKKKDDKNGKEEEKKDDVDLLVDDECGIDVEDGDDPILVEKSAEDPDDDNFEDPFLAAADVSMDDPEDGGEDLIKTTDELRDDITRLADVIRQSNPEKDKKVENYIQSLFHAFPDPEQIVDYFLCIIRAFTEPETPADLAEPRHRIRIAKQVKRLLLTKGVDEMAEVDKFVIGVMKEQLVDDFFLGTLITFNFYRINPIVVVDFLCQNSKRKYTKIKQLTEFVNKFSAPDMRDTLVEIVRLARRSIKDTAEYFRSIDAIFPPNYPLNRRTAVGEKEISLWQVFGELPLCSLARDICLYHESLSIEFDLPKYARHRLAREAVAEISTTFSAGQVEMLDFGAILHDVVSRFGFDSLWLVRNLGPIFPDAAGYLRRKYGYSQADVDDNDLKRFPLHQPVLKNKDLLFAFPSCNKSRKLHGYIDGIEEFDLSDIKRCTAFMERVRYSNTIAASLHQYHCKMLQIQNDSQLLTIRINDAFGFLPISLIEESRIISNVFKMLNRSRGTKRMAMRNPAELLRFLEVRKVLPMKIDLVCVNKLEQGLDAMCMQISGEPMCLRASSFILNRDTSSEAYRHQKLLATVVYLFADKNERSVQKLPTLQEFWTEEGRQMTAAGVPKNKHFEKRKDRKYKEKFIDQS